MRTGSVRAERFIHRRWARPGKSPATSGQAGPRRALAAGRKAQGNGPLISIVPSARPPKELTLSRHADMVPGIRLRPNVSSQLDRK